MTQMFRYPDKPVRMYSELLSDLESSCDYIATQKLDGWRCVASINRGRATYQSRINKELPVSEIITEGFKNLNIDNITFDSEWMKRRPDYDGPECLYVFGITHLDDTWIGHWDEIDRFSMLLQRILNLETVDFSRAESLIEMIEEHNKNHVIRIPQFTIKDYTQFFNRQRTQPETEGIVLKRRKSSLIGDINKNAKNFNWYKVKWRDGADGRTGID